MVSVDELLSFGNSLGFNSETRVLDLCCGYGAVFEIWREAFEIQGVGVDICNEFIQKGQQGLTDAKLDQVKLICDDVRGYQDKDKYDVVICSETFDSIDHTLAMGEQFLVEGER